MNTETMTVHEALCEAKTMDKRIEKAIGAVIPIGTKERKSENVSGKSVKDFTDEARSRHDQATQLITRYNAIKAAINQYNSETEINVGSKTYTIAQAIWMMQFGIKKKQRLRDTYARALSTAQSEVNMANGDKLNARAEQAANANFGSKEKVNTEEYLKFITEYKSRNELELVDPLNLSKLIQEMDNDIADFETHVDSAIQVANATHTITIEY